MNKTRARGVEDTSPVDRVQTDYDDVDESPMMTLMLGNHVVVVTSPGKVNKGFQSTSKCLRSSQLILIYKRIFLLGKEGGDPFLWWGITIPSSHDPNDDVDLDSALDVIEGKSRW